MPLPPEQIDKIRLLLVSSGWRDVIEPTLAKRAHDAIKLLIIPQAERKGEAANIDDAMLRGRIAELEWMLSVWQNEIKLADFERSQLNELERRDGDGSSGTG